MSDDVLCRENLMDLIYFLRHHKAPQDGPELCDWSCACNGRLDEIVAHDAALRARIEELEATLEDLCSLSPDCGHYTVPPKHWVRARRALESDHGEQDNGE